MHMLLSQNQHHHRLHRRVYCCFFTFKSFSWRLVSGILSIGVPTLGVIPGKFRCVFGGVLERLSIPFGMNMILKSTKERERSNDNQREKIEQKRKRKRKVKREGKR